MIVCQDWYTNHPLQKKKQCVLKASLCLEKNCFHFRNKPPKKNQCFDFKLQVIMYDELCSVYFSSFRAVFFF